MELVVFDLDGTLLDARAQVSEHTQETLRRLRQRHIAYTVATGRTLHASRDLLANHGFDLPHIYKNGVVIWQPSTDAYSHSNLLSAHEIEEILGAFIAAEVTPFVFTLGPDNHQVVYHTPLLTDAERRLVKVFGEDRGLTLADLTDMALHAEVTNISALGNREPLGHIEHAVAAQPHLVAYGGAAFEGEHLYWLDIHHSAASKGGAVERLREDLAIERVICFGDSDNDLSMFSVADESYAPSNAKESVKAAATAVIGHHDADGISHFLRERFNL
ncbi:MAG: HAD family hydrolase [Pseudomonadota bacterium]